MAEPITDEVPEDKLLFFVLLAHSAPLPFAPHSFLSSWNLWNKNIFHCPCSVCTHRPHLRSDKAVLKALKDTFQIRTTFSGKSFRYARGYRFCTRAGLSWNRCCNMWGNLSKLNLCTYHPVHSTRLCTRLWEAPVLYWDNSLPPQSYHWMSTLWPGFI